MILSAGARREVRRVAVAFDVNRNASTGETDLARAPPSSGRRSISYGSFGVPLADPTGKQDLTLAYARHMVDRVGMWEDCHEGT